MAGIYLIGGALDLTLLKSTDPHWSPMKVITALCFLLSAAALVVQQSGVSNRRKALFSQIFGVAVSAVGLLTVASYLVELSIGREWSWARYPLLNLFLSPTTRMPIITDLLFFIFGAVLCLLASRRRSAANAAHLMLLPIALMSYSILVYHILNVQSFHAWLSREVTLNTSLTFCALCLASFCARPDTWLMIVFISREAGGNMARRLLPGVVLLPIIIGWLRLLGERSGFFSSEVGVALVAITYTICFLGLVWQSARAVNRLDQRRTQAEQELRQSEERYRSLFMNMMEGCAYCRMIFDAQGRPVDWVYLAVNNAFERLTGLENVVGRKVTDAIPGIEQSHPELFEIYGRVAESGRAERFEIYFEPLAMWLNVSVFSPEKEYFVAVFENITARKQADEALRESEARLRLALEAANSGTWEWNLQTNENIWSEELWKLYGLEPYSCEASYEAWRQTIHPEDRARIEQAVQEAARQGTELNAEWRVQADDGAERWLMSRGQPVLNEQGKPGRYLGIVIDITRRKQAEEERDRQARLLEAIVENTETHLVYLDRDFNFLRVNAAYARACQKAPEEFIGHNHFEFYPHAENQAIFARVRDTGIPFEVKEKPFVFPDMPERGITYWDWTLTPIKHASGVVEALVFALTDVTDQVQMREKLLDVERSRTSLAKSMATEIGHRTKNNLQIVAGILQMQVHNQGDRPLSLDLVQDAISRIRIFAMLQQQMYETQTDTIELLDAAQRIANINRESQSQDDLAITIEGEPLHCPAAAGTNLCVMINELITNAIKYGATDGEMRKIVIRISRREGMLSLSVWNSGNPIPADFDVQKRARVGLDLIRNLAMFHFGGSFELSPQQGGTLARIVIDDHRLRESA